MKNNMRPIQQAGPAEKDSWSSSLVIDEVPVGSNIFLVCEDCVRTDGLTVEVTQDDLI